MIEREIPPLVDLENEKIRIFASQLAAWDRDIVEVIQLEQEKPSDAINLVCRFHPEPISDHSGYIRVINLALRDDHEGFSEGLGIEKFIDLSFILQGKIHLPNGEILSELGAHQILWVVNALQRISR